MEGLRDIKGLAGIPDYSLLYIVAIVFIFAIIVFLIYKYFTKPKYIFKVLSPKELAFKELKSINLDDTKSSVYTFTQNFTYFDDSDEVRNFVDSLEIYKYKKDVSNLSQDDKEFIKNFISRISL
ncbi:hypothetical protein [Campylobacter corcagiensis]|uniref:DUF4381 domain-containing protein n=1 Tax=Campylobacter corcagiensis TaxID=1448857 RepID=A0A7M1LGG1_9BACT|nr:hypothetical protein [Campylobacter corcagiensis]QKF64413.1 hypothetical protein CCORG_0541 [Campylobacter corcagiensis]QOQ87401.1 hypothetical protein IMC76_00855 [Campylobacter corcagiensis]